MKSMFSRWNWAYRSFNLTMFTLVLVFFYIPIVILVIYSFNDSKIVSGWRGFTTKYYVDLVTNKEIRVAFTNTMLIALLSTLISTVFGVLTALGLENKRFTGSKLVSSMLFLPLIMPDILMGVSLALLYNFMQVRTGMVTVLIAHITFCLSYTVIVVRSRLEGFDNSLVEAAQDLGADRWQSFLKVKLPLMMPGVVASMLLAFTLSIDDFIITFFTTGRGFNTLPIYVEGAIRRGTMTNINALSTIMIGLTILLVSVSRKFYHYMIQKR